MAITLDRMHSAINVALVDSAKARLEELREAEAALAAAPEGEQRERLRQAARTRGALAIQALDVIMSYLRGDFSVTDTQSLARAARLEREEPARSKLVADLAAKVASLEESSRALSARNAELETRANESSPWACASCGRRFKSEAALRRHRCSPRG